MITTHHGKTAIDKKTLSGKKSREGVYWSYMAHPPKSLQGTLWSAEVDTMDLEKDKHYIIHQIFSHGSLEDMFWILRTYPRDSIRHVFTTVPYKDYRAPRFYFIKNFLLHLQDTPMNERRYVKNIPRDIRS